MRSKPNRKATLTVPEIEALFCGSSEWLYRNKHYRDAESVAVRKALVRAEKKLTRLLAQKISSK